MIEIHESNAQNVIEVEIIEEATGADIEKIKPVLKAHAEEHEDPRLILILEEMEDWGEVVGLWSDLNMDSDAVNDFNRIALVGNASWKGWLTNAIESLVEIDLKFFGLPDMADARKWVQQ